MEAMEVPMLEQVVDIDALLLPESRTAAAWALPLPGPIDEAVGGAPGWMRVARLTMSAGDCIYGDVEAARGAGQALEL
jgi:hypothetical protein